MIKSTTWMLFPNCITHPLSTFLVEIPQKVSHNIPKQIFGGKERRFIQDEAHYKENKHFNAC